MATPTEPATTEPAGALSFEPCVAWTWTPTWPTWPTVPTMRSVRRIDCFTPLLGGWEVRNHLGNTIPVEHPDSPKRPEVSCFNNL